MGSYIYSEEKGEVKLKPENKRIIKTFKKKLTLLKIVNAMKIYVNVCLGEVQLSHS
jgi:hypothetical protein